MFKKKAKITFAFLLIFTLFSHSAFAATLKVGSRGSEVQRMQQRLNELGFNLGSPDGIFGQATKSAVMAFQRSRALKVDGIAGSMTLEALYSGVALLSRGNSSLQQQTSASSVPSSSNYSITRTLRAGVRGSDVAELQKRLNALGFNCGVADGIFGKSTQRAVIAFQRSNGLAADGIVGPKTLSELFQTQQSAPESVPQPEPEKSNLTPVPIPTPQPDEEEPVPVVTDPNNSGVYSGPAITSILLKKGSKGEDVKVLQNRLNALGFNCGAADGEFGPATEKAVIAFQNSKGLSADGIVGPMTIKALFPTSEQQQVQIDPSTPFEQFHGIANALKGKTVIIDPGHGGSDGGAARDGVLEKTLNLDTALRLQRMLKEAGANAMLTRDSDRYISLFYRSSYANRYIIGLEIEKLNAQKDSAEASKRNKETVMSQKQQDLNNKSQLVNTLPNTLAAERVKLENVEDTLNTLKGQRISLANTYTAAEQTYNQKLAAFNTAKKTVDDLNIEINELKKKQTDLTEAVKADSSKQGELDAITAQINLKEGQLSTKYAELTIAENELIEAQSIKNKAYADLSAKDVEIKNAADNEISIKNNIISLESQISALPDQIAKLQSEITALNNEIQTLSISIDQKAAAINNLNAKLAAFQYYIDRPGLNSREGIYKYADNGSINNDLLDVFNLTSVDYQNDIIFISIHSNSTSGDETVSSGVQVYYRGNDDGYYNEYNVNKRYKLASKLLEQMNASTNFSYKWSTPFKNNYSVLRESNLVSVLVEIGFINNSSDRQLLMMEQVRENAAMGLYKGIVEYFKN